MHYCIELWMNILFIDTINNVISKKITPCIAVKVYYKDLLYSISQDENESLTF